MPKGAGRAQGDEHARDELTMARRSSVLTAASRLNGMTSHFAMQLY